MLKAHTRAGSCGKRPWSLANTTFREPDSGEASTAHGDGGVASPGRRVTNTRAWLGGNHSVTAVTWLKDGDKFLSAGQDGFIKVRPPHHRTS